MKCLTCGFYNDEGAQFCKNCGHAINSNKLNQAGASNANGTTVLTPEMMPYSMANQGSNNAPQSNSSQPQFQTTVQTPLTRPAYQVATNRALWKMIVFGILTLGIYDIAIMSKISGDINIMASRSDGKHTMHYLWMQLLTPLTLGIYPFVWQHGLANRLGEELNRRRIDYNISAMHFWLWGVLGCIIIVGPFIYLHKVCKAINLIGESYNLYG